MASVGFALSSTLRTGFVEAGVCLVRRRALAGGGGRESPRRARYFSLLRQRKVPKRKATPSLRPLRFATGQTFGGAVAGCALELTALRCSFVQTSIASQFTKHARSDARATPQPPRRRRSQRGWDSRTSNSRTTIRAIAALGRACAARGACARDPGPSAAMARVAVLLLRPLWMRRGAQGLADQGSRVSERRAAARVERDPAKPEHRRLPRSEAQGTQTVGSPFFWVLFFGEAKKSTSPAGRLPASALNKGTRLSQCTQQNATKSIAASAYFTSASSQKHPKTTQRAHP
ncbi:hypothetical protein C8C96_2168 [Acidovorax sp. 100]|nr:hypothetical protein C8C96_2168 [Acidovorax sp. 100]